MPLRHNAKNQQLQFLQLSKIWRVYSLCTFRVRLCWSQHQYRNASILSHTSQDPSMSSPIFKCNFAHFEISKLQSQLFLCPRFLFPEQYHEFWNRIRGELTIIIYLKAVHLSTVMAPTTVKEEKYHNLIYNFSPNVRITKLWQHQTMQTENELWSNHEVNLSMLYMTIT